MVIRDHLLPFSIIRSAWGLFLCLLISISCLIIEISVACAASVAPFVVVDASTGEVIDDEDATLPWFPASTTKLMTAYVALRAVRMGELRFDSPLRVSAVAVKQPPSKIGLKRNQEITLENALKIMMVKSANDVAVVVAENIGGSVDGFALRMNREAARLGMKSSHFMNPHGLHNDAHVSSARDMAILARSLLNEFPEYRGLWGIGALQLGKRKFLNTNGLVGRYPGIVGMKTGFICTSGFNLVSAAEHNGRMLIAVVFGAPSAAERTLKAAEILDKAFHTSSADGGKRYLASELPSSFSAPPPNRREDICSHKRKGHSEDEEVMNSTSYSSGDRPDLPSFLSSSSFIPDSSVGARVGGRVILSNREDFVPIPVFIGSTSSKSASIKENKMQAKSENYNSDADKKGKISVKQNSQTEPTVKAGAIPSSYPRFSGFPVEITPPKRSSSNVDGGLKNDLSKDEVFSTSSQKNSNRPLDLRLRPE